MTDTVRQEKLRTVGIYLILILALLRFLVYPLHGAVEKEKRLYDAQRENYRLKTRLLNQQQQNGNLLSPEVKRTGLAPYLYEKTESLTQIQVDVVQRMSVLAKGKGGELVRFEILETIPEKTLSEAPVTLWFSGQPQALVNILRSVETSEKLLGIKGMEINKGPKDHVLSLTLSAYRLEK